MTNGTLKQFYLMDLLLILIYIYVYIYTTIINLFADLTINYTQAHLCLVDVHIHMCVLVGVYACCLTCARTQVSAIRDVISRWTGQRWSSPSLYVFFFRIRFKSDLGVPSFRH